MSDKSARFSATVLMCAPTHFAIDYEINPWMKINHPVHASRAMAQWKALVRVLRRLGIHVLTIPQKKGCPDMVFTANAGVVKGKMFIPSRFRFKERRGEEPAFIRYFRELGYTIRDAARGLFFEGEGDLLPYRDMYFGGFGYRSEAAAHEKVTAVLGRRLIALELRTPRFYHFDTCFLPLDDEHVLYYPPAFDRYGRKVIERFVKRPIAVGKEDAHAFACNGLRVGRTVVLNKASRALKHALDGIGYRVVETPTSEFIKSGGSVKCLLLKMNP